jgi:hypothetical protein
MKMQFRQPREAVVAGLRALQDYHGVVLHPTSCEIWVTHPFSAAPTNFWVQSAQGSWWANWMVLGRRRDTRRRRRHNDHIGSRDTPGHGARGERQVARRRPAHALPRADAAGVGQRRVWYGRHADPDWQKWSGEEAKAIFERFGLTGPTWDIPTSAARF